MERAVISTSRDAQGLGRTHGVNIWIADTAAGVCGGNQRVCSLTTLSDATDRRARAGRMSKSISIGARSDCGSGDCCGNCSAIRLRLQMATRTICPRSPRSRATSKLAHCSRAISTTIARSPVANRQVVGFLACRQIAPGERGDPECCRRPGLGAAAESPGRLFETELASSRGAWFLEVRESNHCRYRAVSKPWIPCLRPAAENYYRDPPEAAIVMRFFS